MEKLGMENPQIERLKSDSAFNSFDNEMTKLSSFLHIVILATALYPIVNFSEKAQDPETTAEHVNADEGDQGNSGKGGITKTLVAGEGGSGSGAGKADNATVSGQIYDRTANGGAGEGCGLENQKVWKPLSKHSLN